MAIKHLHVIIQGRVQGVGYRFACKQRADELGLYGWVKNRPNGSVEIAIQGAEKLLDTFLRWAKNGPPYADVVAVEVTELVTCETYVNFDIF